MLQKGENTSGPEKPTGPSYMQFGAFVFDSRRHELSRGGHRVIMSASQLRLLILFLKRPGELLTRDDIAACLWNDTSSIDVSSGINTAVNRLRRTLDEGQRKGSPIETVVGLGYRFVRKVESNGQPESLAPLLETNAPSLETNALDREALEKTVLDIQSTDAGQQHGSRSFKRPVRWVPVTFALCGMILLTILGVLVIRRSAGWANHTRVAAEIVPRQSVPSSLVRVTADEDVGKLTASAVSPTGQMVAYADSFGISVHSFTNTAERLLATRPSFTVDRLAWFPDEGGLLMSGTDEVLHRQQVWSVPLQGAYMRLLAEDATHATLSQNGSKIAFIRNQDRELWETDTDGQHPHRLRDAPAGESFDLLLWSPASDRLLTTVRKAIPNEATSSATGADEHGALEYLDAESGKLLSREEGFTASSGYLLQDGSFFFIENTTPGPTSGVASMMSVPIDLSSGRLLGTPRRIRDLHARQAGSLTAALAGVPSAAVLERAEADVFVATISRPGPELTEVLRVTHGIEQSFPHSWATDEKSILVENSSLTPPEGFTKWAVFNQPVDGSRSTLLASLPGNTAMAQLSPDGRWILFLQFTPYPQHVTGIFRVPANGGKIEQVPTNGDIEEFHCSASTVGRCVAREVVGKEELVYYALDPLRGMGKEVGRTAWQPNQLGDWGLSVDGDTVAMASHDTLHPYISLLRLGSQPGGVQQIALQEHGTMLGASWAPDGQSLFVESRTENGFELLSLDLTGRVKLLRKSPILIWAVPSRDGKKIAFPGLTFSSSIWASK